jgi:hypothetical protein
MAITSATGTVMNSGSILARSDDAVELAPGGPVNNATTAKLIDGKDYGSGAVISGDTIVESNDYVMKIGGSGGVINNLLIQGANGIRTGSAGTLVMAARSVRPRDRACRSVMAAA